MSDPAESDPGGSPAAQLTRARIGFVALACALLLLAWEVLGVLVYVWHGPAITTLFGVNTNVVSFALCVVLFVLSRVERIPHAAFLWISLGFMIALCATLSFFSILNGYLATGHVPMITWTTVVIAVFPLIVPTPPRATLAAAAAAAATAPLSSVLLSRFGAISCSTFEHVGVGLGPSTGVCIAALGARVLYGARVSIEELRQQRSLLETVLQYDAMAVMLFDEADRLVYANGPSTTLLGESAAGAPREGVLRGLPAELYEAAKRKRDGLYTVQSAGEPEVFHLAQHPCLVRFRPHTLLVLRRMTADVRRQEALAWKNLIRVLSHELNNSLAPASSLLHSARIILERPDQLHRLGGLLDTLDNRISHLKTFLGQYAELARLPSPRPEPVCWAAFVAELAALCVFRADGDPPAGPAWFDIGQMQQVLINLVKNAHEAGSPPADVTIEATAQGGGLLLVVRDRGRGLSGEALEKAMVPFYSTRRGGSGLGLTICREIVEAHGGRMGIAARGGGGAELTIWLPGEPR